MPFARDSQMIVHSEGMLGPICPAASCKPVGKFLYHQLIKAGFPWTLVGEVNLPQIDGKPLTGDDSSWSGAPLTKPAGESSTCLLPDGGHMTWKIASGPLKANTAMNFTFNVQTKEGKPAQDLELYVGMAGHAEFVRSDMIHCCSKDCRDEHYEMDDGTVVGQIFSDGGTRRQTAFALSNRHPKVQKNPLFWLTHLIDSVAYVPD